MYITSTLKIWSEHTRHLRHKCRILIPESSAAKKQTRIWNYCHVPYFLEPSLSFSGLPVTFPPVPNHFRVFYNYSHLFRCLWFVPLSVPSVFFRLCPSTSLFRLVSFQFSILGSDRSEFGSLLLIRLHFCSATIPFPLISMFYCLLILWPPFPLRIMIRFLLFCSVYKFGKLCSYLLACNQTKPPVS